MGPSWGPRLDGLLYGVDQRDTPSVILGPIPREDPKTGTVKTGENTILL